MTENSFLVLGPPGTGKTRYLSSQIERASEKFGSASVVAMSYTKAAAVELAGRCELPAQNVATLHAVCFRALGNPELVVSHLKDFDAENPRWRLGASDDGKLDDPYGTASSSRLSGSQSGPEQMAKMEVNRAFMVPRDRWDSKTQHFAEAWDKWKNSNGLLDFTDLIETALRDIDIMPGSPAVGFVDEAQDSSCLQMALIRKWGRNMSKLVLAGDDDQVLYSHAGADAKALLDMEIPQTSQIVLSQSYRVPRAVHAAAERWIDKVSARIPKVYRPRDFDGEARTIPGNWKSPQSLVRQAEPYLKDGKSVMFLASCSFMLGPLAKFLRDNLIPFHNPYRHRRGDWNPLLPGTKKRTTAIDRLLAFLRPDAVTWGEDAGFWRRHDLWLWMSMLQSKGVLKLGAKSWIEELKGDISPVNPDDLFEWCEPEALLALAKMESGDPADTVAGLNWWFSHCLEKNQKPLEFPIKLVEKYGGTVLKVTPQVMIGTIHSVKGGQADVVVMMPDISEAGKTDWQTKNGRDAVIRMFYVGMTRARESLLVCAPQGFRAVPPMI